MTGGWGISYVIALRWMPLDLTDDKSTLVQVMAWCHQATRHYLSQCWPRSLLPYGVTRSQWVNTPTEHDAWCNFVQFKIYLRHILQVHKQVSYFNGIEINQIHFPSNKSQNKCTNSVWHPFRFMSWLSSMSVYPFTVLTFYRVGTGVQFVLNSTVQNYHHEINYG